MECVQVQACVGAFQNCHPVPLCMSGNMSYAEPCVSDDCVVVDGTRLQPCENDCLGVSTGCEKMVGGYFIGEGMPLMPADNCDGLTPVENFPNFEGYPQCETQIYANGDHVCFCECNTCEPVVCSRPTMDCDPESITVHIRPIYGPGGCQETCEVVECVSCGPIECDYGDSTCPGGKPFMVRDALEDHHGCKTSCGVPYCEVEMIPRKGLTEFF